MRKIIFIVLLPFVSLAQNNDSLEALLKTNIADTAKLQILSDLNWNFVPIDLDKALEFGKQELALAEKIGNQKYIAQGHNDIGIALQQKSKFREAIEEHKKALQYRLKLKDDKDIASSYFKLGVCYSRISDFVSSNEATLNSLKVYERMGSKLYIAYTLNTLCNINDNLHNYDKVIEYAKRSLQLARESEDKEAQAAAIAYLGNANYGKGKYDESIKLNNEALKIFTELGDSVYMASVLNALALAANEKKDFQTALNYQVRALELSRNGSAISSIAAYQNNIANTYIKLKQYGQAERYLKEAEANANVEHVIDVLLPIYKTYSELYSYTGRGKEANDYFQKYSKLRDTVYSIESNALINDLQVKYESEKKESENRLLQNENDLKTAQLSKNRLLLIFLVVGIVLVIAVSYLLFVRARLKQKQALDKELLQQKELRSKAVIEAEEKERVRIARELHDGIGQQLSAAKLNISGLQASLKTNKPEEELMIRNAMDLLDESVKEVRAVSHSMVPNALMKSGLVSAVREFVNKISSTGNLKVNLEIVGMNERLESTIENILFRVLQEVVNNIIKHAQASEVGIQFIRHEHELTILIEDNGVGFDVDRKLNDTEGGIGLKNIQSRVDFLNGQVHFDSYPGKGTTITIEIPV